MYSKIYFILFILIINLLITNNNIKIYYNYNNIMNISMKKNNKTISNSSLNTNVNTNLNTNLNNEKSNPIIKKNNNTFNTFEVQKSWVLNKESEIERETSILINIKNILKQKLQNISIKPNTIHLVIKYVMELIEDTPVKGTEQKELALKVIRELFKDLTEGEDEVVLLKILDDGTIGNMIDLIVDATNGKLNINQLIETSVSCASTCLPYCIKNKNKNKKKIKN